MTDEELKREWEYRYQERLAILGAFGVQSIGQHDIAETEADAAVEALRTISALDELAGVE